jgi:hypothetical protein
VSPNTVFDQTSPQIDSGPLMEVSALASSPPRDQHYSVAPTAAVRREFPGMDSRIRRTRHERRAFVAAQESYGQAALR